MKNIENISKNLELIQRQYNQEEAYYFIINKLIRDSIDDKDISVRDVHKLIRAMLDKYQILLYFIMILKKAKARVSLAKYMDALK